MAEVKDRTPLPDEMYPKLNAEQIKQLSATGARRQFPDGQIIFDQGDVGRNFYVVLKGGLDVVIPSPDGETPVRQHQPGDFSGELDMLSGRPSLVRARTVGPTELLEIDQATLRNIVQTEPQLGELLLRTFVRRRVGLISRAMGDV